MKGPINTANISDCWTWRWEKELIKDTLKVANGKLTCAEALGHREFVMTKLYRSAWFILKLEV